MGRRNGGGDECNVGPKLRGILVGKRNEREKKGVKMNSGEGGKEERRRPGEECGLFRGRGDEGGKSELRGPGEYPGKKKGDGSLGVRLHKKRTKGRMREKKRKDQRGGRNEREHQRPKLGGGATTTQNFERKTKMPFQRPAGGVAKRSPVGSPILLFFGQRNLKAQKSFRWSQGGNLETDFKIKERRMWACPFILRKKEEGSAP